MLLDRYLEAFVPLLRQMGVVTSDLPDLSQEILVKAFRGLGQFRNESTFKTWITRIAVCCARDYLRASNRVRARQQRESNSLSSVPEPAVTADFSLEGDEIEQRVNAAIDALNEPLRLAIVLTSVQGLDASEAAQVCGCSRNAFYARLHKARKILKRELKDCFE